MHIRVSCKPKATFKQSFKTTFLHMQTSVSLSTGESIELCSSTDLRSLLLVDGPGNRKVCREVS